MQPPQIDRLIRSKRKSIGLEVTPEGLLVVRAPMRLSKSAIDAMVLEKAAWVLKKQLESRARLENFPEHAYEEGESFPFLGDDLRLHYSPNTKKAFSTGSILFLPEKKRLCAKQAIEAWYKQEARAFFEGRLLHFERRMGVEHTALRLSSAVTRWGSCGIEGGISLVWRLIALPQDLIDYVAVHELAHLIKRDHSSAFWAEVGRVLPDYKERRAALKACAPVLTRL